MLYLYTGTDRDKVREKMQEAIERIVKKDNATMVRITDAHTPADLSAALQGGGMFGGRLVVVFENIFHHEEMEPLLREAFEHISESKESFFILEEKVDAATRKRIEKFAEKSERFDAAKSAEEKTAFSLANALRRGDKKSLWVSYMREIAKGSAPEMLHGILFWAAKSMVLQSRPGSEENKRGMRLIAALAELPHQSRRKGFDFEYTLEHFVLSRAQ